MSSPYSLQLMPMEEFNALYKRMRRDFPANERPPKFAVKGQIGTGALLPLLLTNAQGGMLAYALCASWQEGVLITHLAVEPDQRGQGTGSRLLSLLAERFSDASLIVEVERPEDCKTEEHRTLAQRRITYYQRAGFILYEEIGYSIWGVKMHLMVKPTDGSQLPPQQRIRDLVWGAYEKLMHPRFMHQVKFW